VTKLPEFKFHPDPIGTGSIEESATECVCCGKARGYIYVGPVFSEEECDDSLCPWCIADGSAHEKLDAVFQDADGIGGYGEWDEPSAQAVEEITCRTPGYIALQEAQWWTHCGEAAQYIGAAGHDELAAAGPHAIEAVRRSAGSVSAADWEGIYRALEREGSPTAYLFKCSTCGKLGGYWDSL
jgi:hypothetical protein